MFRTGISRHTRGRGEGHFTYQPRFIPRQDPVFNPADMNMGLTSLLADVAHTDSTGISDNDIAFTDVKGCGGYRWLSRSKPVMSVPGVPDIWNPSARVGKIGTDDNIPSLKECVDFSGTLLLPLNISPLEPIFHALTSSSVLKDVSMICNRNTLRKLYRLCDTNIQEIDKPRNFRIDAELVGNTVLFYRWEHPDARVFEDPKPVSAQSYHRAATRKIITKGDDGAGCDRLVSYRFAGMKMLVRFDIDACLKTPDRDEAKDDEEDELAHLLADTKLQAKEDKREGKDQIEIVHSGYTHPAHDDLLEIKTRTSRKLLDLSDIYGQLVFSQTQWLYLARHYRHDYSVAPVQKFKLDGPELEVVRKKQEPVIRRVAVLIQEMVRLVKKYGEVGFLVQDGQMKAYKREGGVPALSEMARDLILEQA